MKTGKTLTQLAMEVERIENSKKDYRAPTTKLSFEGSQVALALPDGKEVFTPNANFHAQVAARLKIPKIYYDRMLSETPELLAENVNHWFAANPEKRMVRTLDGTARAFLSDKYRTLDHYDLLHATIPVLQEMPNVRVMSSEVTEKHMYLKVIFPDMETEVKGSKQVGDLVQAGLVISNSEIGHGSLKVEPLIYRLICTNGMTRNSSMKKYHVGKGNGTNFEDIQEMLTDNTKRLTDQAFWLQVQDIIRHSVNRDIFQNEVDRLSEATQVYIGNDDIVQVVKNTCASFQIGLDDERRMLTSLIQSNDFSKFGLANAVTNIANEHDSYEIATDLERIGGKIIDLLPGQWKDLTA